MMKARAASVIVIVIALVCSGEASAQTTPVEVRTSLSQTAVWLGDRAIYTVELRCAPQFDVLLDDLAAARVRVDGGDVVAVREDHEENADRLIRRFHYTLVTYRVDTTEVRVAPITVRYFQRGAGGVQGAPAGQVIVHPAFVAVRSVIPDSEGVPALRIPETLRPAPAYLKLAQPLGLLLIAIAIVPVAFLTIDLAGRARRAWDRFRIRRNRRRDRVSLEDLEALSPASGPERVEAFDRLDALVREHLASTTGLNTPALTPSEIGRALEDRAQARAEIETLLAACERARYAADPPSSEAWNDALREAAHVLHERGGPPSPRLRRAS
jgi:hypothetical protein